MADWREPDVIRVAPVPLYNTFEEVFAFSQFFENALDKQQHIAIAGAGLVGSLLSIYLARRGHQVSVFERRPDMRKQTVDAGRSINLALSNRGLRALDDIGLTAEIKKAAIPMHGRMMHDRYGKLTFQPYGKEGQFINSISRSNLNMVLMDKAESLGVEFSFEQRISSVNLKRPRLTSRIKNQASSK